jgi:aryl-alcohol dehydrogenase-like predicted oxidoreductase
MDIRDFGTTGLKVSALGFGAGHLGDDRLSDADATRLLNSALDLGITLIDTARGYGRSEERIGKLAKRRRKDFILSTKVGYGIPGKIDWTYEAVVAGVHEALKLLRTDIIDIVHLHSCSEETLRQGGVIEALQRMIEEGKVRVPAYSGENEDLAYAVGSSRFRSIQCSINICDQRVLDGTLPMAKQAGMGVIAKRPIANAPWQYAERPVGRYAEEYWHRWKTMNLDFGMDWNELALRFTAYTWGVDSCIVGTSSIEHLKRNAAIIEQGILPQDVISQLRNSFRHHDDHWIGQI